jgi:predicted Fe-S protein YdhL (DUF1289 family)
MKNQDNADLSTTPLHNWPGEALITHSKRAAGCWRNRPEFSPGNWSLYSNEEERAAELVCQVIARLKKEPPKPNLNQITFFYQVAEYCRFGIKEHGEAPRITPIAGWEDAGGEDDDLGADEAGGEAYFDEGEKKADLALEIQDLFKKIGVGERDFSLFLTSAKDFEEATGFGERHFRDKKSLRKQEIINKIKAKKLTGEFVRLMPWLRGVLTDA